MATEKLHDYWTVQAYLAYEQETGIRHEYIDGEIFAMAGGSDIHSEIALNCITELTPQLRAKNCRRFGSDMKVKISATKYIYPDFSIVCGESHFSDEARTMLVNPTLVAEVTSPGSKSYDKTTKADFYRSLASVQAYLIIDQERPYIQLYTRQGKGWFFQEFQSLDEKIELEAIDCTLPLLEIYRDIDYSDSEATMSDSSQD